MYFWGSNTPILIDFITMAIVTYSIRLPRTSAMGHIASLARVAVFLGMLMVAESCWATLYIWMSPSGLTGNIGLHTFVFDMLIFGGMFTILVVRDKGYFWESIPSKTLMTAICSDVVITFAISTFGIPGLMPIAANFIFLVMVWYFAFALIINDIVKVNVF